MVKNIVRDVLFLGIPSVQATQDDLQVCKDLRDTLSANREHCVGMAANMIGVNKNVIIISLGFADVVMLNPKIIKKSKPYITQEGCLSLIGIRKTTRYEEIELEYEDEEFRKHIQKFSGYAAQIIQHEIDHCNGIII